jgi:hypothetical protein
MDSDDKRWRGPVVSVNLKSWIGSNKRTEEVLGFKLFEKTARNKEGYRLTEAGREL